MAIIPEVAGRLGGTGVEVIVPGRGGRPRAFPLTPHTGKGRHGAARVRGKRVRRGQPSRRSGQNPQEWSSWRRGSRWSASSSRPAQLDTVQPSSNARRPPSLRPRPPYQPGPVDGRAVVAGDGVGLPLDAGRRGPTAEVLPHVHDRGGDDPTRQSARPGGRRGRAPGDRHGPSTRSQVRAYDVRAAAKEEVQSLGANFVELELESQEGVGGYARVQSEEFLARQRVLHKAIETPIKSQFQ